MTVQPDRTYALFARRAASANVVALFEALDRRAEEFSRLQTALFDALARRGGPLTARQAKLVGEFERDAAKARVAIERLTKGVNDRVLIASALGNERNQIAFEAGMMPSYHIEARELARQVIAFRQENIAMIERLPANSE